MNDKIICIDKNLCFTEGYNIETILALKAASLGRPITNIIYNKAEENELITRSIDSYGFERINVTEKGLELLKTIEEKSLASKKDNSDIYLEIAKEIREIFPSGRKEGTAYLWRDSENAIAVRLEKVFKANKIIPNKEKIIAATKVYVDSFKGNYTYMQLLKYFIIKDGDSQLLAYLENIDNLEEEDNEWQTTMR